METKEIPLIASRSLTNILLIILVLATLAMYMAERNYFQSSQRSLTNISNTSGEIRQEVAETAENTRY